MLQNTKYTAEYIFGLNEYASKLMWHLKAVLIKIQATWHVTLCVSITMSKNTGLLLAWHTLKTKEICSSEMSGTIYRLTQCNDTEGSDLQLNWQQTVKVSSSTNHVVLHLLLFFMSASQCKQLHAECTSFWVKWCLRKQR